MKNQNKDTPAIKNLNPEEIKLLQITREVEYGEILIVIKKGVPKFANYIKRDVKLD